MSHQKCVDAGHHICQKPSGRECIETGCTEPAGTGWSPYWCPNHDQQRQDRISKSLQSLVKDTPA